MRKISRRTAMKQLGAAAGIAAATPRLLGCSDDAATGPGRISTLVVLCMENRSYDHYLGSRSLEGKPGDGLVEGMKNLTGAGVEVPIFRTDVPCVADPPHGWTASHDQWNAGANDRFVQVYEADGAPDPRQVMGYWTRQELPIHHAIADAYTSCDRWFSSLMGPTWPNRMYLYSAQSGGMTANDLPTAGGFPWTSFMGHLDAAGVPWRNYYTSIGMAPLFSDSITNSRWIQLMPEFFEDAEDGTLPPFAMIEPEYYRNDDHPPGHPILGQALIASVYASLAASPQWNECLFVVTYDEHGGFFDHVSPPKAMDDRAADGFDQLGFRVPALLMGPYVKEGYVSSVQVEHASVLKHAWGMFGLEPLMMRDAAAADLSDALDLDRLMRGDPRPPVPLPEVVVDQSMIGAECFSAKRTGEIDLFDAIEAGVYPKAFDHRHESRAIQEAIIDNLARHGRGRLRRGW